MEEILASIIIFLHSLEVTWLISVERRLSRIEGYLKKLNNYNE